MIPIVFVHHGRTFEWIQAVLDQARKFNGEVYLIGDQPERTHDVKDYRGDFDRFYSHFSNYSTNPDWFESRAFSRWFILNEFMQKNDIPVAFHLDTDVMIFVDVTEDYERWKQWDFTLVVGNCGATVFFTKERVRSFCDYVMRAYEEKNQAYQDWKRIYESMQIQGLAGGVSDMLALKWWRTANCYDFGEMTDIRDGMAYDHVLRESNPGGYRMRESSRGLIKDIQFERGLPYATVESTGERVRMLSLHHQGDSELLIDEFAQKIKESE